MSSREPVGAGPPPHTRDAGHGAAHQAPPDLTRADALSPDRGEGERQARTGRTVRRHHRRGVRPVRRRPSGPSGHGRLRHGPAPSRSPRSEACHRSSSTRCHRSRRTRGRPAWTRPRSAGHVLGRAMRATIPSLRQGVSLDGRRVDLFRPRMARNDSARWCSTTARHTPGRARSAPRACLRGHDGDGDRDHPPGRIPPGWRGRPTGCRRRRLGRETEPPPRPGVDAAAIVEEVSASSSTTRSVSTASTRDVRVSRSRSRKALTPPDGPGSADPGDADRGGRDWPGRSGARTGGLDDALNDPRVVGPRRAPTGVDAVVLMVQEEVVRGVIVVSAAGMAGSTTRTRSRCRSSRRPRCRPSSTSRTSPACVASRMRWSPAGGQRRPGCQRTTSVDLDPGGVLELIADSLKAIVLHDSAHRVPGRPGARDASCRPRP